MAAAHRATLWVGCWVAAPLTVSQAHPHPVPAVALLVTGMHMLQVSILNGTSDTQNISQALIVQTCYMFAIVIAPCMQSFGSQCCQQDAPQQHICHKEQRSHMQASVFDAIIASACF